MFPLQPSHIYQYRSGENQLTHCQEVLDLLRGGRRGMKLCCQQSQLFQLIYTVLLSERMLWRI